MKLEFTPETIDAVAAFLVNYVTVPETREAALEALMDATQEQFENLLEAAAGGPDPLSTPTSEAS
jgi:hypothetical protein